MSSHAFVRRSLRASCVHIEATQDVWKASRDVTCATNECHYIHYSKEPQSAHAVLVDEAVSSVCNDSPFRSFVTSANLERVILGVVPPHWLFVFVFVLFLVVCFCFFVLSFFCLFGRLFLFVFVLVRMAWKWSGVRCHDVH